MITVIIPTIWQCDRLRETLNELSGCPAVGEIILIDNTDNTKKIVLPKLNHVLEGKNTYVGPAWNKGAKMAKHDKLMVLNDDLWFDWDHLSIIEPEVTPERGMLGICRDSWEPSSGELKFTVTRSRPHTFGCVFLIHRKSWVIIPPEIKISNTDTWQFKKNQEAGRENFIIKNLFVQGYKSKSLNYLREQASSEFENVCKQDKLMKQKYNL